MSGREAVNRPQFSRKTHRARRILEAAGRAYPGAWKAVDQYRQIKGSGLPDWPDWCFMPIAAGYAIVSGGGSGRVPPELAHHPGILTGLATWRMTQGIYRFDQDVFDAVAATPLDGELPTALLYRLPEWCVYVELDARIGTAPVYGFWAWLEFDVARNGGRELRVLLDAARNPERPLAPIGPDQVPALISIPLDLGAPDLQTALGSIVASGQQVADGLGLSLPGNTEQTRVEGIAQLEGVLRPALSLLLYICSQTGEISNRGRIDRQPSNPRPKKTRRQGWRLFAADGPVEWDVGVRMGAALRTAYARERSSDVDTSTDRNVRAHVRRAHWHTFLSGRRKRDDGSSIPAAERRRELRWLPPIAVNIEDFDSLPATIRKVT